MKKSYLIALLFSIICTTMSAQLVLNEVLYDPDNTNGDANRDGTVGNLDDEFIELVNTGAGTLDISGYKVYDKTRFDLLPGTDTPRHTFPAGTILAAGQIIVVFGDTSDNSDALLTTIRTAFPTVIFQKANPDGTDINANGSLDLQNGGDDVYINDASGTNVITFKPADLFLNMASNQSAARKTSISGDFVRHLGIDKTIFSPGEQKYLINTLVLNETLFDGNGDANQDGTASFFDDEFIEFVNNSGASADISGYKIFDFAAFTGSDPIVPRHIVPANTIIPDGGVYIVFGGGTPGSDTGSTFGFSRVDVASSGELNLSNSDDSIYVLNASDELVISLDYSEMGGLDLGNNQSATKSPDISGSYILHPATGGGVNFSPGFQIDGTTALSTVNKFTETTGNWSTASNWSLGNVPLLTDVVEIPSGSTTTLDADNTTAKDVVVSGNLTIDTGKSLTIDRDLYNIGTFTINAGGSLIVEGSSTGNVTYNRTLDFVSGTTNGWHLVASPVAGQTYNDAFATANGLATNTPRRGLAFYNDALASGSKYTYLLSDDTNASLFNSGVYSGSGVGYSAKRGSAGTIAFTGTINTADVNGVSVSTSGNGFNLLGVPYTSYMSSQTFLTANTNLDQSQIWVWKQDNTTGGNFIAMTAKGDNFILAPGQGFFVKANSGTTVNFAETNQTANADTFQKTARTEVKLLINDGENSRFAKFYYINNVTKGFDSGWEGETFNGIKNSLDVFSQLIEDNQGKNYQVQSLPISEMESLTIPIGLTAAAGKEITFSTESLNLPNDINVYIEDRELNIFTDLNDDNYKVILTENTDGVGRFYLHTSSKSSLSVDANITLDNISIYKADASTLRIIGLQNGNTTIKLFNILGKQVLNSSFNANGIKDISLPNLTTGVYIVQLETESSKLNKKIVLE